MVIQTLADLVPLPGLTDPYSYTNKTDQRKDKLTDLSILGVPDQCQGRAPTVTAFPNKFNDKAKPVWVAMIESEDYQDKVRVWGSLDLIWHNAIQEFLGLCEDKGIYPFDNGMEASKNEYVKDAIRAGRILLVQYANECKLFEHVRIRKAFREYKRTKTGMVLISWADLYPLEEDVGAGFEKWLMQRPLPRMYKMTSNRYVHYVRPHIRMWVRFINRYRVRIGFEIDIAGQVSVPRNKTATRKEVDAYIDRTIYLPTIRAHRFKGINTRLF